MSIPLASFTDDQKEWYAETIIAAVLADNEINSAEVLFLKPVLEMVKVPKARKRLMEMVSRKQAIAVPAPPNLEKEVLAAVFTELILIVLCDLDFDRKEMVFLEQTSDTFRFSDHYFQELMNWASVILEWRKHQRRFVPEAKGDLSVPIADLNREQKSWYASLLISTIMLDKVVDTMETEMLKAALSIVEDQSTRTSLVNHIRNRIPPTITDPPFFPKFIRRLIFLEVISLLSVDDVVSYQEQFYLSDLAKKSGISMETYQEMLDWNNSGILWKRSKSRLIAKCELIKDEDQGGGSLSSHQNVDCNSIIEQYFQCRVCGSKQKVAHFHLKLNSHHEGRNIFGVKTFQSARPGYDFIKYNRLKITVCPVCFFSSGDKKMFRKGTDDSAVSILEKDTFRKHWFSQSEAIKGALGEIPYDLFSVHRSPATAILSYKIALKSMMLLDKMQPDLLIKWDIIHLMLGLAEVLSDSRKRDAGDKFLNKAAKLALEIFNASENRIGMIPVKCAGFLFKLALYTGNVALGDEYMDFFSQILTDKVNDFQPDELPTINHIISDVKAAYFKKATYRKDHLDGYHLRLKAD